MNDGIEYAKMIEIPMTTCEYAKTKKRKFFLKRKVVKAVNEKINKDGEGAINDKSENGDSVSVEAQTAPNCANDEQSAYGGKKKISRENGIITAQVVAAFALVVAIILTNIFWENSAMNTLFKSVFVTDKQVVDERAYSDFSLNLPVKSEGVTLVEGVIGITGEYSLYPICEGTLKKVEKATDGSYTLTIKHSESFSSVIEGADFVYFGEGDLVNPDMPLCHTSGQASVYLYDNGTLLTDYAAVENSLVFNK